ncbi:MAG: hypothetical protein ACKO2P_09630, partial [Planctomycetota bacterium]
GWVSAGEANDVACAHLADSGVAELADDWAVLTLGDPRQLADRPFIFRWGQTNAYQGQAFMQGPEDEGWHDRVKV